eukprot:g1668.t1
MGVTMSSSQRDEKKVVMSATGTEQKSNVRNERLNLKKVRAAITDTLRDFEHDDGSWGPLYIRLAWHCCGTYSKFDNSGGSNGGTMRFPCEKADPENRGLTKATERLESVHKTFPFLSKADLYILAGYVAIEASGGPRITFRSGRKDFSEEEARAKYGKNLCPFAMGKKINPNGSRLPAADMGAASKEEIEETKKSSDLDPKDPYYEQCLKEKKTIDMVRSTFQRLGMTDQETVVLIILGHQYGRCHPEISGYEFPWYTFGPADYNIYEHGLGYLSAYGMRYQEVKNSTGKRQWNLSLGMGEPFMMLAVDRCLLWDPAYRKYLNLYNRDRRQFKVDAVKAWTKLTELGCEDLVEEL